MSIYEQAVFISYAWGAEREDIVNEIDETLQQRGIRIVRDKRALGYRGSIKEFMERIGQGRCVIVVISDKYLRSPNCMFELVEISENKQFHDRVFPVVLSDANIYDPLKRIEYVKYWEAKRKELAKAMRTLDPANLQGIRDDMDQYDRIRDKISGITSILKDMNTLTPDVHRDSEFSNLYDAIVKRLEEGATDVTIEFNDLAKKAEEERLAKQKADEELAAKAEADYLAAQKVEEERIAQVKIEADRKAKEEAERLATQKAEEEQLAFQKAKVETERKAREGADHLAALKAETDRLAQQKADEERLAQTKIEADRKAKGEAESFAAQEAEAEQLETEKAMETASMPAEMKAASISAQSSQKKPVRKGLLIGGIAAMVVCLIGGIVGIGAFFNNAAPAANVPETPLAASPATEAPAASSPATEAPVIADTGATPDCTSPDVFCVGLVTDFGSVNDGGFNQSAWEGVQQSQTDNVANVINYVETSDSNDYAKNIATFGDAHYDVIVTVGFLMSDATITASGVYPKTKFIGVDQFLSSDVPSVVGLNFPEDQAGFLVGALAAMMSNNHKIGAVCGTDLVPPVWRYGEGYRSGAAYADAAHGTTTEVLIAYHNDVGFDRTFTDPEWGAATAKSMMNEGADTIFGCGGNTGNSAMVAAAQAGVYAIGIDSDQYYTLSDAAPHMLSSAIKLIAPSVTDLIKMAKESNFPTGNYFGQASYAPFHDLESNVPDEVKAFMVDLQQKLADGSVQTSVSPTKP
jgi:basic membrane protein A